MYSYCTTYLLQVNLYCLHYSKSSQLFQAKPITLLQSNLSTFSIPIYPLLLGSIWSSSEFYKHWPIYLQWLTCHNLYNLTIKLSIENYLHDATWSTLLSHTYFHMNEWWSPKETHFYVGWSSYRLEAERLSFESYLQDLPSLLKWWNLI